MNLTHNGKIGRLPKTIREQLNRRLENGEKGPPLVAWLNSLPEVQALLAAEFDGKPIRQQNLSDWRKHGYAKWLRQREALDLARQLAADIQPNQTKSNQKSCATGDGHTPPEVPATGVSEPDPVTPGNTR
jgi:hypothetical protein